MQLETKKLYHPYLVMLVVYLLFFAAAFLLDTPAEIREGIARIVTSRSVLITDYMAVGGIGATLVNSALVGLFGTGMLIVSGVKPNGSSIMALWLTVGFAMFGKNMFNMLPITFGVWLYSKVQGEPYRNYSLVALLSATLSPVVSGIGFHPDIPMPLSFYLGVLIGVGVGFLFPIISSFTVRVHGGYNLYNMGFAGGLMSTFIVAGFESVGMEMPRNLEWSTGNNLILAILLYVVAAGLMIHGFFPQGKFSPPPYGKMMRHTGRVVTDLYVMYGNGTFFNMGLLCAVATTVMLLMGADLNGPTLCGIFTIVGFAAFGKHLRNVTPVMLGAILATYINLQDPTAPVNTLAILFSTGLAPIAGQFGWTWGLLAGFLHVNTITHIGFLNSGLNLYNNGYAAGFVALLLVPIILAFRKDSET